MQSVQRSFRVSDAVVAAELDSETVLLNAESGIYFGLDEVGSIIWSQIASGADEDAIIERIVAEYDADPLQVAGDVREFIDHLESKGLLLSEWA